MILRRAMIFTHFIHGFEINICCSIWWAAVGGKFLPRTRISINSLLMGHSGKKNWISRSFSISISCINRCIYIDLEVARIHNMVALNRRTWSPYSTAWWTTVNSSFSLKIWRTVVLLWPTIIWMCVCVCCGLQTGISDSLENIRQPLSQLSQFD